MRNLNNKKKKEGSGKSSSSTMVLGLSLLGMFVILSFIIARQVFLKQCTATTRIIEARTEKKATVFYSDFISAMNSVETLSGSITSVFYAPESEWENLFRENVRGCIERTGYESVWIVLEPTVFGERVSFCYSREDGHIVPDEVSGTDEPWYAQALKSRISTIDDEISHDTINGKQILTTSAYSRILDDTGSVVGLAGIDIVLSNSSEEFDTNLIFEGAKFSIVNSEGFIMATNNTKYRIGDLIPLYNPHFDLFHRPEEAGPKSFLENHNLNTILPFSYDKSGKMWTIVVETPMSQVIKSSTSLVLFIVIGFLIYLVMQTIGIIVIFKKVNKMREEEKKLGKNLAEETQNLVVAAKENAATSQDQSAAVKEIVATMEDTNDLSQSISLKIEDVNSVAQNTSDDVNEGEISLNSNVEKLREISEANQQTIEGIKTLSEEINNIWDIVTMITSVADQAKIIAFNAELEAASAGEAGKNFHIVATEVRRLADGIIDNTKEIKDRISGIQRSSDALILAGESGTAKVSEGVHTAHELQEKFSSIKSAAEITANSAKEISTIIQQQTAASGQILIALKQISAGVDNFSMATSNISSAAENIKVIAAKLDEQQDIVDGANL